MSDLRTAQKATRSLVEAYPDIAKYWHPTKNGTLMPENVSPGSNKNVWWTCSEEHVYDRNVYGQVRSAALCPICTGKRLVPGINDVMTKYPNIADEWDEEKNAPKTPADYTFASSTKVGWKCKTCGNKWETTIKSRCIRGTSCNKCAKRKIWDTRFAGMNLGITDPALLDEWDYELNEKGPECYSPKSSQKVHWRCKTCGYRYEAKICNKANGRKCACCQRKVVIPGINDLATTHPNLAKEWDQEKNGELRPQHVLAGTRKKVFWRCPQGHSYEASINHRTTPGRETYCPKCNDGRQTSFAEQAVYYYVKKLFPDARSRYKDLFENRMELDIYIPSIKVAIEYDGEAWHKPDKIEREKLKYEICKKNGIRLIRLVEKVRSGVQVQADEAISVLDGPMYEPVHLQKAIRILVDELDSQSNPWTRKNPLHIHSDLDINIFRDEPEIRKYMTVIKGSLAEKYPELVSEWDFAANGDLTPDKVKPGATIKVGWICPTCNKHYTAFIYHRTGKKPTGCPDCGIKKNTLKRSKTVAMTDLQTGNVIKTFTSIAEASRKMNISDGNISAVCKNNGRTQAGGYGWKYIN